MGRRRARARLRSTASYPPLASQTRIVSKRERFEPEEDRLFCIGESFDWRSVREVEVEFGDIDAEIRLHR